MKCRLNNPQKSINTIIKVNLSLISSLLLTPWTCSRYSRWCSSKDPGGSAGTLCPIMAHPEWGKMLSAPPSSPWFSAALFSVSFSVKNNGRIVTETQATLNVLSVCLYVSVSHITKLTASSCTIEHKPQTQLAMWLSVYLY